MNRKAEIAKILKKCVGRRNAITSKELARTLGIKDAEANPTTRALITSMIEEDGYLYGATSTGYFTIADKVEFDNYIHDLDRRVKGIIKRKTALKYNLSKNPKMNN